MPVTSRLVIPVLVRTLLGLLAVSWLLSAATGLTGQLAPCLATPRHIPTYCHELTHLELDLLSDLPEPTRAFNVDVGEIGPGEVAPIRVFGATDDVRFYRDVSHEVNWIQIGMKAPKGSQVAGRIAYAEGQGTGPRFNFVPAVEARQDRVVFLDFTYHCILPRNAYRTRFMLTIRGTDREPPEPATLPPADSWGPRLAGTWQAAQVTPIGRPGRPTSRYTVTGALHVQNQGDADAGASRMALFLSRDADLGPEDTLLGFSDAPSLAEGASAEVPVDFVSPPRAYRPRYVIAVLDSSNYVYEQHEANRTIVYGPLP